MWAVAAARLCVSASPHFARAGTFPLSFLSPTLSSHDDWCWLLQRRGVVYNKVTKNKLLMNKTRDASFEDLLDNEKKLRIMKRIIAMLLKRPSAKMSYRFMLRRGKDAGLVKPQRMSDILKKYPRIVRVYREPNEIEAWVTLAKPVLALIEEERMLKQERAQFSTERLRKVLMMSAKRRIRLDRINYIKEELGLPGDFKETVIKSNPQFFKLVKARKVVGKVIPFVKLIEWDPQLAIPAIEEHRQRAALASGLNATEIEKRAYTFPISLPPGFKIKRRFRIKLKNWQEVPYRSPYEDTSDLNLQSEEALKRGVAVLQEFLHISVEKRTRVDRLANLREDLKLPQKIGVTVLQNPGIFYMSIKGNVHTIFLREAYKKGEPIQKDALHGIKEKFLDLIRMGRKSNKEPEKAATKENDVITLDVDDMQGDVKSDEEEEEEDEYFSSSMHVKSGGAEGEEEEDEDFSFSMQGDVKSDEGEGEEEEDEDDNFSGKVGAKAWLNDNDYSKKQDDSADKFSSLEAVSEDEYNEDRTFEGRHQYAVDKEQDERCPQRVDAKV